MAPPKQVARAYQGPPPLFARQPLITIYSLFVTARFLACLPLFYLYKLAPSNRTNSKRKMDQELLIKTFKTLFNWIGVTRSDLAGRPMVPAAAWKDQFVLMQPPSATHFVDFVGTDPDVKPGPVPGAWYPRAPTPAEIKDQATRFLIHFHGGAYTAGSYDPSGTGASAAMVVERLAPCFVLAAGYRKASVAGNHFPAQLQDAITAYAYLVSLDRTKIVVSGDSSGGHLALTLLRYLLDHPEIALPKPAAIAVDSPWVDMQLSDPAGFMARSNYPKDIIDIGFVLWSLRAFKSPHLADDHRYYSLMDNPFDLGGVPVWMETGLDEVTYPDHVLCYERFKKVPGNNIELNQMPDCVHDPLWAGITLGFQQEAQQAADALRDFLVRNGS